MPTGRRHQQHDDYHKDNVEEEVKMKELAKTRQEESGSGFLSYYR